MQLEEVQEHAKAGHVPLDAFRHGLYKNGALTWLQGSAGLRLQTRGLAVYATVVCRPEAACPASITAALRLRLPAVGRTAAGAGSLDACLFLAPSIACRLACRPSRSSPGGFGSVGGGSCMAGLLSSLRGGRASRLTRTERNVRRLSLPAVLGTGGCANTQFLHCTS